MTGTGAGWDMNWDMDCDGAAMWQSLAICGWGLQLALLVYLPHRSLENRRWLLLFLLSLLLPANLLATCQFRFAHLLFHAFMPTDFLFRLTLGLAGLASFVGFLYMFLLWLASGPGFFHRPNLLHISDMTDTDAVNPSAGRRSVRHQHFTLLLALFTSGWILLSGMGTVLAQGGSDAPASPPPSTGTPSTGSPSGSGTARRGPRRVKRPKADKMQIKALSMVGFLTSSVRYIRDSLGPAVIMQLRKLQPAFVALAYGLLVIISLFTLWRMASESDDASAIPAFVLRMIICGVLIGLSSLIVQTLFQIGFIWTSSGAVQDMVGAIEMGAPGGGFSMSNTSQPPQLPSGNTDVQITTYELRYLNAIDEWRRNSKERFITGLEAFRQNKLKVRIGQSRFFDPKESGLEYFVPDFSRAGKDGFVHQFLVGLNPKNWSPLQLYSALEVSILVMQIGIFTGWILLVFVMPFAELLAPVFFSVAIDKGKLFDQMTMPFIRGLITASLIMPLVNIILEGIAYNIASLGFSVFDIKDGKKGTEVFQWDPATEQIVATADPTVLVFTTCFFILVSGLSLILSPVIAYRIMSGEIFGAAVGAISGWTAGLVSLGVSAVSQGVGASFQRQAEHLSNVGSYQSAATSAAASAKAAHIRNEAEYHSTLSQIRQNMSNTVASTLTGLPSVTGAGYYLAGAFDALQAAVFYKQTNYKYAFPTHSGSASEPAFSEEQLKKIKENNPRVKVIDGKPWEPDPSRDDGRLIPASVTDPKLVPEWSLSQLAPNYQELVQQTASNPVQTAQQFAHGVVIPRIPKHVAEFGVVRNSPVIYMVDPQGTYTSLDTAKFLGARTDPTVRADLTRALRELSANPGQKTFSVAGHDLTAVQLNELKNYYVSGLSVYPETVKKFASGIKSNDIINDNEVSYEMFAASIANTYFGNSYAQWVQIETAKQNAALQIETAEVVRNMQDEAAKVEYSGQVGAAGIAFNFAERAAALRARWQFIQGATATFQSVLARQIENNRV